MSYSSEIKTQLTMSDIKSKCCAGAELYAHALMNGNMGFLSKDKNYIKRINALASKSRGAFIRSGLSYRTDNRKSKNKRRIEDGMWGIRLHMLSEPDVLSKPCCAAAFIRGCFICAGYITKPDQPARIDISFKSARAFELCGKALEMCDINYNTSVRNGRDLIYIKSVESVSSLLVRVGAVGAMLELENSRIIKKYKSDVNRAANCDNANLDKTVSAAMRQKTLISEFMKTAAFEELSDELKAIAKLRVDDESLSLKDIGMMMTPPISKSGAAHRLKKLEDMARKMGGRSDT